MNAAKFVKIALVTVVASFAAFANAADIRTAEPMAITAKRSAPAVLELRVAQPMVVVAKRDVSTAQVASKAADKLAANAAARPAV